MRTESQIKRKRNELVSQRQALESRTEQAGSSAETDSLKLQAERLSDMIDMLEWVLNEPSGSYH
ncbi:hypothetical protein [Paenibacillus hexagrammi]|uniref:Uncharacterized protein n=1 Tax=Paenibacillus hexagrammi TaxID=2908839 RepID=A0ABY3SBL1_9BACL|nr:hypothetical protein [Paenibacillus sp. YPD9-1]UJF31301.1 hypothetical protein L0M14_15675 [Paenibacillus sp. YPD9-1]